VAPAATLREHPLEQQGGILNGDAKRVQKLGAMWVRGDIEQGFHQRWLIVSSQHVSPSLLTQTKSHRPDDHILTRPCLTREHIEPRAELHHGTVYQRIIFDM